MIFAPGFRGGPRAMTLSFVASASSNADTVIVPASAAAGDLAVLFDTGKKSFGSVPNTQPTGYTAVFEQGVTSFSNSSRTIASYRVLGSGEAGNSISGIGADRNNKVVFVFRPSKPIATVTPSTWTGHSTTGDPDARTVSASGQTAPLVVFGMAFCDAAGTTAFSTESPSFDAKVSSPNGDQIAGYKVYNASPANHTVDMNDLGTLNQLIAGYLQVAGA